MKKFLPILYRWSPALVMMIVIFLFSSTPGSELPNFLNWDYVVKKSGHMIGYGLLALSYFHLLRHQKKYAWFAWALAIGYAMSDEFHQSFVAGRHASLYDVLIFDNLGALAALWLHFKFSKKRRGEQPGEG